MQLGAAMLHVDWLDGRTLGDWQFGVKLLFVGGSHKLNQQKGSFYKQATIPNNALLSSYKVAHRIAKCKKPHTIAEELILPAAVDMVNYDR
jgi:hypothetical protein